MPFFVVIALWACVAGLIVFVIKQAPFIDPPYKQFAIWAILAGFVVWLVMILTGYSALPGTLYVH